MCMMPAALCRRAAPSGRRAAEKRALLVLPPRLVSHWIGRDSVFVNLAPLPLFRTPTVAASAFGWPTTSPFATPGQSPRLPEPSPTSNLDYYKPHWPHTARPPVSARSLRGTGSTTPQVRLAATTVSIDGAPDPPQPLPGWGPGWEPRTVGLAALRLICGPGMDMPHRWPWAAPACPWARGRPKVPGDGQCAAQGGRRLAAPAATAPRRNALIPILLCARP